MRDKQRNSSVSDDRHCPNGFEILIPMKHQTPQIWIGNERFVFWDVERSDKGMSTAAVAGGSTWQIQQTVFTARHAGWNNIWTTTKAGRGVWNSFVCIRNKWQVTPGSCNLASWKLRCWSGMSTTHLHSTPYHYALLRFLFPLALVKNHFMSGIHHINSLDVKYLDDHYFINHIKYKVYRNTLRGIALAP